MTGTARTLFILRYLQEHSDCDKEVSAAEIMTAFRREHESISRPTLRKAIASLQEAGYEILVREVPGSGTYYTYPERFFSTPELQILSEAVGLRALCFAEPQRGDHQKAETDGRPDGTGVSGSGHRGVGPDQGPERPDAL